MKYGKVYCVVIHPDGDIAIIDSVFRKWNDADVKRDWIMDTMEDAYVEVVEMEVE